MEFLKNIFRRRPHRIPRKVNQSLKKLFPDAKNVEWSKNSHSVYEVSFYHEGIEKIAKFNPNGLIIECRINTPINQLPSTVRNSINSGLEIMNCIEVVTSEQTYYELIVRNTELVRYLLIIDPLGQITKMEKL